ncbi:EamA family transporter [Nocardiopsis sp. HNM0947]|uniref:EamA family transporter n=1 Tax=Nocardiopsis coralli TaxID=2772213 RepID=A0ABR9NZZ9_9ACTN|nr:EamA family transporter [Nocardiopsis coralli]MBE2997152.1 EamA family transporter [Nocardiopsis coralli]
MRDARTPGALDTLGPGRPFAGRRARARVEVAFGYPLYFMLRRRFRVDTPSALMLEVAVLVPASAVFVLRPEPFWAFLDHPENWLGAGLLGLLTAAGFTAHTIAQRSLPMSLFGLLAHLEPILLVVASVLVLGESLGPDDALTYGAIAPAIMVLVFEGLRTHRVSRLKPSGPPAGV